MCLFKCWQKTIKAHYNEFKIMIVEIELSNFYEGKTLSKHFYLTLMPANAPDLEMKLSIDMFYLDE